MTSYPLIVDLDGTLVRTDTLVEGVVRALFSRPLSVASALLKLPEGRPAFKRRLAASIELDIDSLPVREDFLAFLEAEKAKGRAIHLVTAADQRIADQVARRFDVFDSATGTSGDVNLKGRNKQSHLRQRFPDGYVYAGDSAADLAVWRDADGIVLAGASRSTARAAAELGKPVEARFENDKVTAKLWRKALRVHQWAKNLLIFAPLLLSGSYTDPGAILASVGAFLALGLVASGTYLLNDLSDLASDRRHRSKRFRPLASGALPVPLGLVAAPLLIASGLALAAAITPGLALVIAIYLATTLGYSFGLKRRPIVDVLILAGLFTLRLLIGIAALKVETSFWLMSFSMFFFLSLSLAKRHVEIAAAPPLQPIRGRGYVAEDAMLSLSLGTSSAMASIVILCLYLIEDAFPNGLYPNPDWLLALPVVIGFWTLRIWLLAHRGELDDDPVSFAVRDRLSLAMGGVLALAFLLASLGA